MTSEKWNVLVISEDNEIRLEQLERKDWYAGIHRLLDGAFCEVVHCWGLPHPQVMLVDDCGAINGSVYNPLASMLYRGPHAVQLPIIGHNRIVVDHKVDPQLFLGVAFNIV